MKPNLSAMSWMVNETASCSVKSVFPGQVAEYNKEIEACAQEENVPTSLTPILEKMVTGNGGYGLESEDGMPLKNGGVSDGAGHGNFGGLLGCSPFWGSCRRDSDCCSNACSKYNKCILGPIHKYARVSGGARNGNVGGRLGCKGLYQSCQKLSDCCSGRCHMYYCF